MNHFVTFGHQHLFIEAGQRITEQASKIKVFDHIIFYKGDDLMNMPEFWEPHKEFIDKTKSFGCFLWKPFIILRSLETMNDGDVLWYADSGCEIDTETDEIELIRVKQEFLDLIEAAKTEDKIIASYCNTEKKMTKMDLFVELDMQDNQGAINSLQIQSTSFILVKSPVTMKLAQDWYRLSCNYHLLDNSPSIQPNFPGFDSHRHDQSIFSLLVKKYNLKSDKSLAETMYLSRNRTNVKRQAPHVVGSSLFCHLGFLNYNQVGFLANQVRKRNPKYVLETGFFTGRVTVTILLTCKQVQTYVNCDPNYGLSGNGRLMISILHNMYPCFQSFEKRSQHLFQNNFLKNKFPNGIDWLTCDGDETYEGVLCDLINAFPHMNSNGIILVNHYKAGPPHDVVNDSVTNACDFFYSLFQSNLTRRTWNQLGMGFCIFEVVKPYSC